MGFVDCPHIVISNGNGIEGHVNEFDYCIDCGMLMPQLAPPQ
jgi:hypothetical protein